MADTNGGSQQISIGRLYEIAFGWLGMSNADFENATYFQFNCRLKGWLEIREADRRDSMDLGRLQLDALWANLQWKQARPEAFKTMPMPWDPKPEQPKRLTDYEQALKDYKFKRLFPTVKFNSKKEANIEKHLPQLMREVGPLEK